MMIDAGHNCKFLNFPLTTAFSSITTTLAFRSAFIQALEDDTITLRLSSTDTVEFTLKPGAGIKIGINQIPDSGATITICQAKIATGTGTLQVILTR